MSFYDEIKVIDTILDKKDNKHKMENITYPSMQKVTLLTAHIRRWHVPRQINIRSGKTFKVKLYAEGVFSANFKKCLLKDITQLAYLCRHCIKGSWAYVRVGVKTYTIWLKGEGENMSYANIVRASRVQLDYN